MRLIPVKDRESDYSQVSPLIKKNLQKGTKSVKSSHLEAIRNTSPYTMSYFVWLTVALVTPVVTYKIFEQDLAQHFMMFKQILA
jgi:hypothetical protein